MITLEQIKNKLSDAIYKSGMTEAEIARKIGVSPETIASYARRTKTPPADIFANLCKALRLDTNDILCLNL